MADNTGTRTFAVDVIAGGTLYIKADGTDLSTEGVIRLYVEDGSNGQTVAAFPVTAIRSLHDIASKDEKAEASAYTGNAGVLVSAMEVGSQGGPMNW